MSANPASDEPVASTGLCVGCLRTLDEIAVWGALDDDARRDVLQAIAARRAAGYARYGAA